MSDENRDAADELRAVDDAIAEDTLVLREIEHTIRDLPAGDPRQQALSSSANAAAHELAEETATAADLARDITSE